MKKTDFTDIKALDLNSLAKKAKELRGKIADNILDHNMNKIADLKTNAKAKKDLAQVLTVLNQKKLLEMLGKEEQK